MIAAIILLTLYLVGARLNRAHQRGWIILRATEMCARMDIVRAQIGEKLLPALAESAQSFSEMASAMARFAALIESEE